MTTVFAIVMVTPRQPIMINNNQPVVEHLYAYGEIDTTAALGAMSRELRLIHHSVVKWADVELTPMGFYVFLSCLFSLLSIVVENHDQKQLFSYV